GEIERERRFDLDWASLRHDRVAAGGNAGLRNDAAQGTLRSCHHVRRRRPGCSRAVRARELSMSHIILVRHGQASFLGPDYDKLCANGEAQARLLGEYWSRRGVVFGGVYSGPRVRQLETARIVGEAYRSAGLFFPETVVMSEFDEYQAEAALRECLPQLLRVNAEIQELRRAYENSSESGARRRTFQKLFEAVISKWVAGEVSADGVEPW